MMRIKKSSGVLVFLLYSGFAFSDYYEPHHYCTEPYKPYQFESESEVALYEAEVEVYKQCILNFIEEQESQIINHKYAIDSAINEWNSFASSW